MSVKSAKLKIGLICGGSSLERGISLNSARSAMDHLESEDIEIVQIYFDSKRKPYRVSKAQLYSNTPSDFDFKLQQAATPLNEETLVSLLKTTDIVFPVMHGPFGEDGEIRAGFLATTTTFLLNYIRAISTKLILHLHQILAPYFLHSYYHF